MIIGSVIVLQSRLGYFALVLGIRTLRIFRCPVNEVVTSVRVILKPSILTIQDGRSGPVCPVSTSRGS